MNPIKPKFHLIKRAGHRHGLGSPTAGPMQAVALVDERYLGWLAAQQNPGQPAPVLQREALMPVFAHLTRVASADASLLRTCLFTDRAPSELHDDVLWRTVPAHAVDGGLGMVRALGQELNQLAQRGGCQLVLVASDDERLIPYIDEAQWRGLKVVLVTDETSSDFARLMNDDPSWARLLLQADRRVSVNATGWQALTTPGAGTWLARPDAGREAPREREPDPFQAGFEPESTAEPDDDWRAQVERVIREWWDEETPHARLDLFDEMQGNQGVPPDADRHLLLRVRRELARPLNFPEKKAMREMIRSVVLAQPPAVDAPVES